MARIQWNRQTVIGVSALQVSSSFLSLKMMQIRIHFSHCYFSMELRWRNKGKLTIINILKLSLMPGACVFLTESWIRLRMLLAPAIQNLPSVLAETLRHLLRYVIKLQNHRPQEPASQVLWFISKRNEAQEALQLAKHNTTNSWQSLHFIVRLSTFQFGH